MKCVIVFVRLPVWYGKYFMSFSYSGNLFHHHLGEWNTFVKYEKRKKYLLYCTRNRVITFLLLALRLISQGYPFHSFVTMFLFYVEKTRSKRENASYLPHLVCQTQELNFSNELFGMSDINPLTTNVPLSQSMVSIWEEHWPLKG